MYNIICFCDKQPSPINHMLLAATIHIEIKTMKQINVKIHINSSFNRLWEGENALKKKSRESVIQ